MGALASRPPYAEGEPGGFILANTSRALRRFLLSAALVFFAMYTAATRAFFFVAVAVLWELVTWLGDVLSQGT